MFSPSTIPIITTVASLSFSIGLGVGLLLVKFRTKRSCKKEMTEAWDQINAIRNLLIGKKITFELRQVTGGLNGK